MNRMGYMINRQESIDEILAILESAKDKNGDVPMRLIRQAFDKLSERKVDELPSSQPEPQWIPCSERLPDVSYDTLGNWSSEYVLLFYKDGHYDIGHFNPNGIFEGVDVDGYALTVGTAQEAFEEVQVIAWMPLPEPYREEGE